MLLKFKRFRLTIIIDINKFESVSIIVFLGHMFLFLFVIVPLLLFFFLLLEYNVTFREFLITLSNFESELI